MVVTSGVQKLEVEKIFKVSKENSGPTMEYFQTEDAQIEVGHFTFRKGQFSQELSH